MNDTTTTTVEKILREHKVHSVDLELDLLRHIEGIQEIHIVHEDIVREQEQQAKVAWRRWFETDSAARANEKLLDIDDITDISPKIIPGVIGGE